MNFNVSAQLNGTYTINSALPTGGTNFQTFAAASNALSTVGVNGPVVINVVVGSGPYTENFYLGTIPGSSATNRVRLNGNGNTIQFAATTTDPHIVRLIGTKFLTINDLVIKTTSIYGWGVSLSGGAESDSIINCIIDLTASSNTSSAYSNGITLTGNHTTISSTGSGGRKCYIGNNQILGSTGAGSCYNGIRINTGSDSNIVQGNLISNFHYYGLYLSSTPGTLILDNEFHRATKTSTGIGYGMYIINSSPGTYILRNRVHTLGGTTGSSTSTTYGIHFATGHGSAAAPNIIANNVFYNFNQNGINYGISTSSTYRVRFYHNTVVMDKPLSSTSATYGIYANGTQTETEYKNNIVSITGGTSGTKYGYYFVSTAGVIAGGLQRNNVYVNSTQSGTQYHSYFGGTTYATLAAFQAGNPAMEIGSLDIDPSFQNMPTDFIPGPAAGALATNGLPLNAFVPLDFDLNVRNVDPTPGAYEMNVEVFDNAGADTFVSPTVFCPGQYPVAVTIKNEGDNDITTVQVNWEFNGIPQTPVIYNGLLTQPTINLANSKALVNLGLANFVAGANTIKWWTSSPNNNPDPRTDNDTAFVTINSKETPVVDLGPDRTICYDEGYYEFLDAQNPGSIYLWDNNYAGMVRSINATGTYWVTVTNIFGCVGTDTVNITFAPNPKSALGNDTSVCNGTEVYLNAGNTGVQYYWNNGANTNDIKTKIAGQYYVNIIGENGCITVDTINIEHNGEAPKLDGIHIQNLGTHTFKFNALNPQYIIGYEWDFGDGSPKSYLNSPTHQYNDKGNYLVKLNVSSSCGIILDTMTVHIYTASIGDIKNDNSLIIHPNPANDKVSLSVTEGLIIENVKIYSILGAEIGKMQTVNSKEYTLSLDGYANGMYLIMVTTNKGIITKKLEVIK